MDFPTTPLEEAFGMYLLENVFQITNVNSCKVPGRSAVPFLSQSNLPRDLLRRIWSTVDPHSTGSLTSAKQFYAILKLVALGQVGLLSSESNLQDALSKSPAPLPIFQGYTPPNEDFLRHYYEHKTGQPFPMMEVSTLPTVASIDDAFGGLLDIEDAPLPTLPPANSSFDSNDGPSGPQNDASSMVTPNDPQRAVSELTMETMGSTTSSFEPGGIQVDIDGTSETAMGFGQFSGSMSQPLGGFDQPLRQPSHDEPPIDESRIEQPNLMDVSGVMGTQGGNWDALGQTVASDVAPRVHGADVQEPNLMGSSAGPNLVNVQAGNWDALDALTPAVDAPAPILAATEESDTFGDFEGISDDGVQVDDETSETANVNVNEDTTFGDFEGITTEPLSEPLSAKNGALTAAASDVGQIEQAFEGEAIFSAFGSLDDGVGDVKPKTLDEAAETDQTIGLEDNATIQATGTFEEGSFRAPAPSPSMSEWGAFDALTPLADAPLPSLQEITRTSSAEENLQQLSPQEAVTETNGTDFGDFQDSAIEPEILAADVSETDGTGFGDFQDPAIEPKLSAEDASETDGTGFGNFQDTPNSCKDPAASVLERDATDFGDFQDPTNAPRVTEPIKTEPTTIGQSLFGAFDGLADTADAPLPPLQEFVSVNSTEEKESEMVPEAGLLKPKHMISPANNQMATVASDRKSTENDTEHMISSNDDEISGAQSLPAEMWGDFGAGSNNKYLVAESDAGNELVQNRKSSSDHSITKDEESEDDIDLFGDFTDAPSGEFVAPEVRKQGKSDELGAMVAQIQPSSKAMTMARLDSTYYSAQEPPSEHSTGSDDFSGFVDAQSSVPALTVRASIDDGLVNDSVNEVLNVENVIKAVVQDVSTDGFDAFGVSNSEAPKVSRNLDDFAAFAAAPPFAGFEATSVLVSQDIEDVAVDHEAKHAIPFIAFDDTEHPDPISVREGEFTAFHFNEESESKHETHDRGDSNELDDSRAFASSDQSVDEATVHDNTSGHTEDYVTFREPSMSKGQTQSDDDKNQTFDDFGDFASGFENNDPTLPESMEQGSIIGEANGEDTASSDKEAIIAKSAMLPSAIRRRIDGSAVDFAAIYDRNIGLEASSDKERKLRATRCLELMKLLGGPQKKLAARLWRESLQIIHGELAKGIDLTKKALAFTLAERSRIASKLSGYVGGLAGFVLVARCIAAILGDLLLLDEAATLTDDNLISLWNDVALAKQIADIELQWKRILKHSEELLSSSERTTIENVATIEDLRRQSGASSKTKHRCSFTLLPLSSTPMVTSMTTVVWEQKDYFACSANFLANCCPFYNVSQ